MVDRSPPHHKVLFVTWQEKGEAMKRLNYQKMPKTAEKRDTGALKLRAKGEDKVCISASPPPEDPTLQSSVPQSRCVPVVSTQMRQGVASHPQAAVSCLS